MEVIERLDFKPNDIARGLATSKTTTIAIVFPQSLFAHVKNMIGGIGDTGRHLDYNINMYTTDDIGDENTVADITERLVKSRVDGAILFNNENIDEMIESCLLYTSTTMLRANGFSVDMDYQDRSLKAQFKTVDRMHSHFALIIGDQEVEDEVVNIKCTHSKTQDVVPIENIVAYIENHMEGHDHE